MPKINCATAIYKMQKYESDAEQHISPHACRATKRLCDISFQHLKHFVSYMWLQQIQKFCPLWTEQMSYPIDAGLLQRHRVTVLYRHSSK